MSNVKEALVQTKQLAELYAKRLSLLGELAQVDVQIDAASKGGGGGNGNGNGTLVGAIVPITASATPETAKRRGRPKGSTNKKISESTAPEMTAGKRYRNTDKSGRRLSLKELIITVCARHRNGIKLDELVRKVHDFGYMSTSDDKGFVQNIRTNLHTLINSKQVVKDADKKYHAIVPDSAESELVEPATEPATEQPVAAPAELQPAMAVA